MAGFVGYDGMDEPETAELSNVSHADRHYDDVKRYFGKWWKSVCKSDAAERKQLRDESNAKKDTPTGIDVLTSEQLYLTTRLSVVTARATQYSDVVALFQALGGGWWNRSDVEQSHDRSFFPSPASAGQ